MKDKERQQQRERERRTFPKPIPPPHNRRGDSRAPHTAERRAPLPWAVPPQPNPQSSGDVHAQPLRPCACSSTCARPTIPSPSASGTGPLAKPARRARERPERARRLPSPSPGAAEGGEAELAASCRAWGAGGEERGGRGGGEGGRGRGRAAVPCSCAAVCAAERGVRGGLASPGTRVGGQGRGGAGAARRVVPVRVGGVRRRRAPREGGGGRSVLRGRGERGRGERGGGNDRAGRGGEVLDVRQGGAGLELSRAADLLLLLGGPVLPGGAVHPLLLLRHLPSTRRPHFHPWPLEPLPMLVCSMRRRGPALLLLGRSRRARGGGVLLPR
ncbi:hypothetical protein CALCODRAFT_310657 [Calocera cornea HHB12733]|uniref:Uncharacterized protein n=1 Tax=Calocera cornea HHB12733 TaxID=1353952 RepID=A0A165FF32_9BASI|nr:hypothetical protein CALCODRAFT_310657 [Calocera cornea HHB12733]